MYADYFGLDEPPFAITPDPRYLYLGARHAEALAHLLYGIREGGGFVLLTGEVGTGKTTLTRCLLDELPDNVDVALLLNPRLDVTEFLEAICQELGLPLPEGSGNRRLVETLNRHLLARHAEGRRTVLIVDEAQNLSPDVLEQVRLLTNLETAKTKLLQILLIGQPELRDIVSQPELRQLAQRITARYHLEPLDREELPAYISHRLGVAGARGPIFDRAALAAVWKHAGGIPRRVNLLCDRALLGAYSAEAREVSPRMVRQAAHEVDGTAGARRSRRAIAWAALLLLALAAAVTGWYRPGLITPVTADAPVEPASPAEPSLQEWLARHAADAGTNNALDVLFGEWQLTYRQGNGRGDVPACEQAANTGLRCLHGEATWRALVSLDRPAVLELVDRDGARFQAVVTRIAAGPDGETALLRAGEAQLEVPAVELGTLWTGEYLALWRPPADIEPPLLPGTNGPGVDWLREHLDRLLGEPGTTTESATYDAALADKVRRFQAREGLNVDGIAGRRTLLRMNALLRPDDQPWLSGERDKSGE